jgi:hypothetical protein
VLVKPSAVQLTRGESYRFSATVFGSQDKRVIWSLNPAIGTISSTGVYAAPSTLNSAVTKVKVIATSIAAPASSGVAVVNLSPTAAPNIMLSPVAVTLGPSQVQKFTATVTGLTKTSVAWSITPSAGSISNDGLYTAPANIASSQTITLKAISLENPAISGSTTITLQPAAAAMVKLPVEVIGPDGTTVAIPVSVSGVLSTDLLGLNITVHGLRYETQASVQVNNSAWMPLNNTVVALDDLSRTYGGIGGGFHTFKITLNLPAGAVFPGVNVVRFRFNRTDGVSSGFRILAFNIVKSGAALLPASLFTQDDPNTWQPPSLQSTDIQEGKRLWYQAPLTAPTSTGPASIRARCTDCHAQDGRDLKYFSYSNNSIRARSIFHGLTARQGDQIASYIRTLPVSSPGRPWNPPYQPGPGLDSRPVSEWAAGAGIESVLRRSADMLPYLAPAGDTSRWAPASNLNVREIPIALQLPDWNHWLPKIHPLDSWGDEFANSEVTELYQEIRKNLRPNDPVSYSALKGTIWIWLLRDQDFLWPRTKSGDDPAWKDPAYVQRVYSMRLWSMVKNWEINQEFGLEGLARTAFGPRADERSWYSPLPFFVSPNMMHIPSDSPGLGSVLYLAYIWYHTQLILNPGNNGDTKLAMPADLPYTYDFIQSLSYYFTARPRTGALMFLWLIKALQASENMPGPEFGSSGWAFNNNDPSRLLRFANLLWGDELPADKTAFMEAYLRYWIAKARSFKPQQYYDGKWASPTDNIDAAWPEHATGNAIAAMIPLFRYYGVNLAVIDEIVAWAKTVWPNYDWDARRNATNCTQTFYRPACTL